MVKKILSIATWVITGAALIVLFVFAHNGFTTTPLQGVVFNLERQGSQGFVEKDTMISAIEQCSGINHHNPIGKVDMMKIKQLLHSNPWIEHASAYIGLNDTLIVNAKEHHPILRVFDKNHQSVYVTRNGTLLPPSPNYTPRLVIASGELDFDTDISDALTIAKAIIDDDFLKGSVGQIYKNDKQQYELMVNSLNARVIVGDTNHIQQKMTRLRTLLEKHSGTDELTGYKTLDLRYKNQIVCTKK